MVWMRTKMHYFFKFEDFCGHLSAPLSTEQMLGKATLCECVLSGLAVSEV